MKALHSRTPFRFVRNAVGIVVFGLSAPLWGQQGTPQPGNQRTLEPGGQQGTPQPAGQQGTLELGKQQGTLKFSGGNPVGDQKGQPGARTATSAFELREELRRAGMEKVIPEVNVPAGETLAAFAEFLSEKTGANIVIEESLKDMALPALKLRNVNIRTALEAARINAKQSIGLNFTEDRGPGALLVTISSSRIRGEQGKPRKICRVFRLVQNGPGLASLTDRPWNDQRTTKALTESVDHIAEAARQACGALASANGKTKAEGDFPTIEVHHPTHLLMVIGEETDVDLVGQIISGVGGVPMNSAKPELPTRSSSRSAIGQ